MPVWHELRSALRSLVRDRVYTTIAILTLAFGIAANAAIFSIVDGVLLRPLLASLLFGVSARDPLTIAAVVCALATVAAAACYVPAWRATHADPLAALRCE